MATMDQTTANDELTAALAGFETSLETPVISGELSVWVDEVQKSWSTVLQQIDHQLKHLHPHQYEEIGAQDPELLPKVELLVAEDEVIERERDALNLTVKRTAQHVPKLEPDEEKGQRHTKKLIDEGLAFVGRVRKQEVAIRTWFLEAFNRDRGPVD